MPSRRHGRSVLMAIVGSAVIGCGGTAPSTEPVASGPVKVEVGRSTALTIGLAGGTLTATAADGTAYTLEIPPAALPQAVEITMTPVRAIDGLPLTGGLAGAVELRPSGTRLARPATLRITTSRTAPAGQRLIGFTATDDLATRALAPASSADGTVSVLVFHFSAVGAGFGTEQDLRAVAVGQSFAMDSVNSQIFAFPEPWDAAASGQVADLLHDAFDQFILPGLQAASSDLELLGAIADYWSWRSLVGYLATGGTTFDPFNVPPDFASEVDEFAGPVADKLELAIDLNDILCGDDASIEALANVIFWQKQAEQLGVATAANGLDEATVLADLCAAVELVSHTLTSPLVVGGVGQLDMVIALKFRNGTVLPWPFALACFTIENATLSNCSGNSDLSGAYTTGVTPTAAGPVEISFVACVIFGGPGSGQSQPCGQFTVTGSAQGSGTPGPPATGGTGTDLPNLAGSYVISGRSVNAQQCGAFFSFTGTATVVQSAAAVTVTWTFDSLTTPDADSCLQGQWAQVVKSGAFSGTLVGDMTVGFRIKGIALQCGGPVAGGEVQVGLSPRLSIVIVNDCGPSVFARADFAGP